MKIKIFVLGLVFLSLVILSSSQFNRNISFVYVDEALNVANNWLTYINEAPIKGKSGHYEIKDIEILLFRGMPLLYIYHLNPMGHLVISAYKDLSPIRSFSFYSDFLSDSGGYEKIISDEIKDELNYLKKVIIINPQITSAINQNKKCWVFWERLRTNISYIHGGLIREEEIGIEKPESFLFNQESERDFNLAIGKVFSPSRKAKVWGNPTGRKFINNIYVAKYYQHIHRNIQKKRLETNSFHSKEKIKTKSADISLISNTVYSQSDYFGDLVITGAVKNIGTSASMFTKINVSLYDKNNNFIGSDSTYIDGGTNVNLSVVYTNALLPGEKGFFKIWTSYKYSDVDHWAFAFDWDEYSYSLCNAKLEFDGTPSFSSDYTGDLYISGKMKNTCSNFVSYFSTVFFAIYNADGKVIEVNFTYVDGDIYDLGWTTTDTAIYPGQSWPFETYTNAPFGQFYTYEHSFEWDEAKTGVANYTISGKVTTGGTGELSGVTMTGLPGNPTTDVSGNYSAKVESGWSGTVTPIKTGYTFSPSSRNYSNVTSDWINQDYTALYVQYTLTISAGTGGTTDPSPGNHTYDSGTEVIITAIPKNNYRFSEWDGDASGTSNPITITMDSDKSVTANFIRQYKLTLASTTGGTTDPSSGTYTYDSGIEVTVKATPESNYRFKEWSGDVTGTDNPITITMNSDKSLTANFIREYTLTIAAGPGGTTDPAPGARTYDSGTQVTISAKPNSGYRFINWSGNASGSANPITITMDSDKSVTANFVKGESPSKKKGGCFIATAAYGSPLHRHVKILCDFRDTYLMPSKIGRKAVKLYYKYSPFVANLITKHKAWKVAALIILLPLVMFSYSMLHFGPVITAVVCGFIFVIPIIPILLCRRKMRRVEAKDPKVLA